MVKANNVWFHCIVNEIQIFYDSVILSLFEEHSSRLVAKIWMSEDGRWARRLMHWLISFDVRRAEVWVILRTMVGLFLKVQALPSADTLHTTS